MRNIFRKLKRFVFAPPQPNGNGEGPSKAAPDPHYLEDETDVLGNVKLLKGKTVLITGAGRNIGKAIALESGLQGARIIFTDNHQDRKEALEKECQRRGIYCVGFLSDISKRSDTDSLLEHLSRDNISIDTVIHNAGAISFNRFPKDFVVDGWDHTFQTNILGPMYLTKQLADRMIKNSTFGSFIFITSIHQSVTGMGPEYSASKAALEMIIKELALDLAPFNIRVNGIAPGDIREDESGIPVPSRATPLSQLTIKPSYIGRAAVYLASNYFSKFTTGTIVKIDGGLSLQNYMSLGTLFRKSVSSPSKE